MYRHSPPRSLARRDGLACPFVNRYLAAEPLEAGALEATRLLLSSDEAQQLARQEITRLRDNAGTEQYTSALRDGEAALATTIRAALEANSRAARAATDMERRIHGDTMRELAAEAETLTVRVEGLRSDAARITDAEARLPAMEERLASMNELFAMGSPAERKGVVAAVVESMRVDFEANAVEVRVRAA